MNDPRNESPPQEDEFARRLAEQHERMIDAEQRGDTGAVADDVPDPRIQSAMLVLQLLEQIKPSSADGEPVALETRNDPSTRKAEHRQTKRTTFPAIEKIVPNLERLGRFQITEQIGRGGFGIVVRARDPQLDRDIAIKIPRLETALSADARRRFQREAKAAAALNHQNIVSVYETGSEHGIDFIVTELIDGENLATYLARGNTFSPREASQLMATIADALEHAHQRNVLHRDIKPSNILLAKDPAGPKPLIADFGLAAMSDQQEFTQTGALVGTPAYMSPEQAAGNNDQIGPSTDVYGLGTILYQLLTGQSPFAELPIIEMLEAIHRRDPAPPRALDPMVPKDIESICMKCLEKNPARRYASAQELQADLQRFINDTPVLARRITFLDRSLRWVRRNPVLATVGTSSFVFLLIALIASIWGWNSTSAALVRENQAKNDARETVNRYFTDVAENDLLDVPGLLPLRKKLLTSALEYYQQYLNESSKEPELVREIERAHFRVGKIQNELGNPVQAIASFETSIALQDQLLAASKNDPELLARKFESLRHLGQTQNSLGNYDLGLAALDFAIEGLLGLVESRPNERDWQYQLSRTWRGKASMLAEKGEFKQAVKLDDDVIGLLKNLSSQDAVNQSFRRDLAETYLHQADAISKDGNIEQAAAAVDLAIQIFRRIVDSQSPTPKDISALSSALFSRAGKHLVKQEVEPARPLLEEAYELNNRLVLMFPNAVEYRQQQLNIMNGLGFCYSRLKLTDRVVEVLYTSIETLAYLQSESADNPKIVYELAVAQMNLGSTLAQQTDQQEEARSLLLKAEKNFEAFLSKTPDFFQGKMAEAFCQLNLAAICNQLDEHESSLQHADRSIELLEAVFASKPGVPQVVQNLAGAYHNRADALEFLNRWDESVPVWRTAVKRGGPFAVRSQLRLAAALAQISDFSESKMILESLETEPSARERFAKTLGRAQASIAKAWSESGDVDSTQVDGMLDQAVASFQFWFQRPENRKLSQLRSVRKMDVYEFLCECDDFKQLMEEVLQSVEGGE